MAVLEILHLGHPCLRTPAGAVAPEDLAGEELQSLIDRMLETMRAASGVGLAAPQVGHSLQIFVYSLPPSEPEGDAVDRVLVNPMVEPEPGDLVQEWEGCLSIPGLRGLVPRHPAVRAHGLDRFGRRLDLEARGLEARVIQHEFDHLSGIIFLDRMRDLRSLAYEEERERFLAGVGAEAESPAVG